jgi:hypothetical protein
MPTPAETIRAERLILRNAVLAAIDTFITNTGLVLQRIDIQFTAPQGSPPTTQVDDVIFRWTV